jgi:DNA polymerase elongation subunit (family B)
MKKQGWLLDANVDHDREALILWIKRNGKTQGYIYDKFKPALFVHTSLLDAEEWTDQRLFHTIREHSHVTGVDIVRKYTSVYDDEKSRVLQVFTEVGQQREVAKDLEKLPDAVVYHAEIGPVQQFFLAEEIFAFGRIEFETEGKRVTAIKCLDNREEAEYDIPDLEEIGIEVYVASGRVFPLLEDPISHIEVYHRGKIIQLGERTERETLLSLQNAIDTIDPDIIVTRGGDDHVFRYLTLRAKLNEVELVFSRDGTPLNVTYREPTSFWQYNQIVYRSGNQVMFNGRIHIDRSDSKFRGPSGIEGVIEGCRLAFAPPQRVARMSIGSVNASVQFYTAHQMDVLIPPVKRNPEFLKSINELANIDRGGLIFQPRPDIYEHVAEVDFSSMYPTLMVTRNISPETICMRTDCPYDYKYCIEVPELNFRLCNRKRGLIAKSLELVVRKRNEFKRLIAEGEDTEKYAIMQNTLKGVLVSCFGYLGFKNAKFGRVEAHTAVCALAREVLLKTQEIGQEMGLQTVHGIVDSLWVKAENKIDFDHVQEFCKRVSKAVDIDMSLKGVYRWMVIPSSRLHPKIAPLNRYYGVYQNGGIKTRGIETRRRDTCLYVGDCQSEMIKTLAKGKDKEGFLEMIPEAYLVCQDFSTKLREGDVDLRDLVLHSRLTREPHEYKATSRAAVVAKQLVESGRELHAGQKVRYILTDTESPNPLRRVRAVELLGDSATYDPKAYEELCIRAFENLVPIKYLNGFSLNEERSASLEPFIQ